MSNAETGVSHRKFSALYDPYFRCVNLTSLKLMALLYEDVIFVDPMGNDLWPHLMYSRQVPHSRKSRDN